MPADRRTGSPPVLRHRRKFEFLQLVRGRLPITESEKEGGVTQGVKSRIVRRTNCSLYSDLCCQFESAWRHTTVVTGHQGIMYISRFPSVTESCLPEYENLQEGGSSSDFWNLIAAEILYSGMRLSLRRSIYTLYSGWRTLPGRTSPPSAEQSRPT